ncbi:hypothetical protein QBC36DRAFT_308080 [Triangularia setosa]|uniref:Uncharacterized protein n=1 Tax=Triangularia setosa TaxID=2587417 RepID=A0AAN6WEE7_9PEZI|nr:hypothetical protein QBC36DRAFT_308080 [Podospora setosa]
MLIYIFVRNRVLGGSLVWGPRRAAIVTKRSNSNSNKSLPHPVPRLPPPLPLVPPLLAPPPSALLLAAHATAPATLPAAPILPLAPPALSLATQTAPPAPPAPLAALASPAPLHTPATSVSALPVPAPAPAPATASVPGLAPAPASAAAAASGSGSARKNMKPKALTPTKRAEPGLTALALPEEGLVVYEPTGHVPRSTKKTLCYREYPIVDGKLFWLGEWEGLEVEHYPSRRGRTWGYKQSLLKTLGELLELLNGTSRLVRHEFCMRQRTLGRCYKKTGVGRSVRRGEIAPPEAILGVNVTCGYLVNLKGSSSCPWNQDGVLMAVYEKGGEFEQWQLLWHFSVRNFQNITKASSCLYPMLLHSFNCGNSSAQEATVIGIHNGLSTSSDCWVCFEGTQMGVQK